ncbi:MAG TPA: hypothetical protein VFU74_22735 [Actinocrinis sp.]|nr:hypothetical protein [Actinocrinis sp.]
MSEGTSAASASGTSPANDEMQQESDHLREVIDDARQAVARASDADSMESGGIGIPPEDVQDTGSGHAEGGQEQTRS